MSLSFQHETEQVTELLLSIAAGNRDAEAAFVRAYEPGVRVLIRRRCRPGEAIVDDLVQDVLTRILERLRHGVIRDPAALPAYIQTTIAYATNAEYRRRPAANSGEILDALFAEDSPSDHYVA